MRVINVSVIHKIFVFNLVAVITFVITLQCQELLFGVFNSYGSSASGCFVRHSASCPCSFFLFRLCV